jgi:hypothetical protein
MSKQKKDRQFLFSDAEVKYQVRSSQNAQPIWVMDISALKKWKDSIAKYQNELRQGHSFQQGELFDLTSLQTSVLADGIDPFSLRLHNFFFFDRDSEIGSDSCLYFVIDTLAQLLLYVGQTHKADRRWSSYHDCKRYVENYKQLHFTHGLAEGISTAFYWEVPPDAQLRQKLELSLILRWKPPFNKENWQLWSTPFVQ